jgi:hypothetical protein
VRGEDGSDSENTLCAVVSSGLGKHGRLPKPDQHDWAADLRVMPAVILITFGRDVAAAESGRGIIYYALVDTSVRLSCNRVCALFSPLSMMKITAGREASK